MNKEEMEERLQSLSDAIDVAERDLVDTEKSSADTGELQKLREELEALKEEAAKPVVCRCCGREAAQEPVKVTEEVLKQWFRSMLGQRAFSHTFSAYEGMLNIEFTEITGSMSTKQEQMLKQAGTGLEYSELLELTVIVGCLTKIWLYDKETDKTTVVYEKTDDERLAMLDDPRTAREDIMNSIGHVKFNVVRKVSGMFVALLAALIETGQDENFYKGAGLY